MKKFEKIVIVCVFIFSFTACGGGSSISQSTTNQAPTADADKNRAVEVGKTITITGFGTDSDGTIATYEWKKGTTSLASTASFAYAPTVVGTDTLTLTVTDDDGATHTDSMDVIVSAVPTGNPYSYIPTIVDNKLAHSFLLKSTFGPTPQLKSDIQNRGIVNWVDEQLNAKSAYDSSTDSHLTYMERTIEIAKMSSPSEWGATIEQYVTPNNTHIFNEGFEPAVSQFYTSTWLDNALDGEDQLRQRVAHALNQIVVLSDAETFFAKRAEAFSYHNDILAKNAFGNYRDILIEVSKSPGMGLYLTHQGSKKYDATTQRQPDENYAREIMQLFSIGLAEMNMDGSIKIDANGNEIPTYTQADVEELSRVFTGWDPAFNPAYGHTHGSYTQQMEFTSTHHDFGEKTVLGETIASGKSGEEDVSAAIDILMNHPNIAPYISKHLIMRLVTSNPTPSYISRVSHIFKDNGNGVKGDLKEVIRAILIDEEAIKIHDESSDFGKAKEPLIAYTQFLRAFEISPAEAWDSSEIGGDGGDMIGVYRYSSSLKDILGQAPMRAKSVFNFYSPDYIPNDSYFQTNNLVAPELQIQSAQKIINYSNRILYDTAKQIRLYYNNPSEDYGSTYGNRYLIHFVKERELIEAKIGGDYANIRKEPYKTNAVHAVFDYINEKLTASTLSDAQVKIIKDKLLSYTYRDNHYGARDMIAITIRAIVTTNRYMIQK